MRRAEVPYVVAYVTLDEGPSMLTNIVDADADADADAIRIGQRVAVRFQRARAGRRCRCSCRCDPAVSEARVPRWAQASQRLRRR